MNPNIRRIINAALNSDGHVARRIMEDYIRNAIAALQRIENKSDK